MEGLFDKLNSKLLNAETGVADNELDIDSDDDGKNVLIGEAKRKNKEKLVKKQNKLKVQVYSLKFSPDGTTFSVASTEGLLVYSRAHLL